MLTQSDLPIDERPRDIANWAQPTATFTVGKMPSRALNLNVDGRMAVGPLQGFGQLWQKTFRVRFSGVDVTPSEVIRTWKEQFSSFWPAWNHFYKPLAGIKPGEVAVINMLIPGDLPVGLPLSTGVMVLYADEESFTFMNPQGHMFAGWITFSAYEDDGCTVAQVQMLVRANDPAYEIGFRLGASKSEDEMWHYVLTGLAAHFGVTGYIQSRIECIDPNVQWPQFWNIWQNAAIRTVFYRILTPLRWMKHTLISTINTSA